MELFQARSGDGGRKRTSDRARDCRARPRAASRTARGRGVRSETQIAEDKRQVVRRRRPRAAPGSRNCSASARRHGIIILNPSIPQRVTPPYQPAGTVVSVDDVAGDPRSMASRTKQEAEARARRVGEEKAQLERERRRQRVLVLSLKPPIRCEGWSSAASAARGRAKRVAGGSRTRGGSERGRWLCLASGSARPCRWCGRSGRG